MGRVIDRRVIIYSMIINATVTTGTSEEEISKLDDGGFRIRMKEQPIKGLANRKTVDMIAKHFKVPVSQVRIKLGTRSRHKVIEIIN